MHVRRALAPEAGSSGGVMDQLDGLDQHAVPYFIIVRKWDNVHVAKSDEFPKYETNDVK